MRTLCILGVVVGLGSAMAGSARASQVILLPFNVETHFTVDSTAHDQNFGGDSPLAIEDGVAGVDLKARALIDAGNVPMVGTYVGVSGAVLSADATAHALTRVNWTVTSDTLPAGTPVTVVYNLHTSGQLRSDSARYASATIAFDAYDGGNRMMSFYEYASLQGNAAGNWASLSDYAGTDSPSFRGCRRTRRIPMPITTGICICRCKSDRRIRWRWN